jgi:hypothetical protein
LRVAYERMKGRERRGCKSLLLKTGRGSEALSPSSLATGWRGRWLGWGMFGFVRESVSESEQQCGGGCMCVRVEAKWQTVHLPPRSLCVSRVARPMLTQQSSIERLPPGGDRW